MLYEVITIGKKKNTAIICNIKGVPLITRIYIFKSHDKGLNFDILPSATSIPKGIEKSKVKPNILSDVPMPENKICDIFDISI